MRPFKLLFCLALARSLRVGSAGAETVVRYGISIVDIPLTAGQPPLSRQASNGHFGRLRGAGPIVLTR